MSQLYNNREIIYYNGRNGTWLDWNINNKSSWFTVCFNDEQKWVISALPFLKMERLVGINGKIMVRMWLKAFF